MKNTILVLSLAALFVVTFMYFHQKDENTLLTIQIENQRRDNAWLENSMQTIQVSVADLEESYVFLKKHWDVLTPQEKRNLNVLMQIRQEHCFLDSLQSRQDKFIWFHQDQTQWEIDKINQEEIYSMDVLEERYLGKREVLVKTFQDICSRALILTDDSLVFENQYYQKHMSKMDSVHNDFLRQKDLRKRYYESQRKMVKYESDIHLLYLQMAANDLKRAYSANQLGQVKLSSGVTGDYVEYVSVLLSNPWMLDRNEFSE